MSVLFRTISPSLSPLFANTSRNDAAFSAILLSPAQAPLRALSMEGVIRSDDPILGDRGGGFVLAHIPHQTFAVPSCVANFAGA